MCNYPDGLSRLAFESVGNVYIVLAQFIAAQPHEAFDRVNSFRRFQRPHSSGGLSDERFAFGRKVHDRRSQSLAVFVRDENWESGVHHADERIGRPEIDTGDWIHWIFANSK